MNPFEAEQVARDVPLEEPRKRGGLARLAVTLWYEAGAYDRAISCAEEFLAGPLTDQGCSDLRRLITLCEEEKKAVKLACELGAQLPHARAMSLADECQRLTDENREILAENARLRREIERKRR